jgi:hypothetical protein
LFFFVFVLIGNTAPEKIIFPGSSATTGPGAWGGMAGKVFPIAFNVDEGKLTLILYGLDMTGVIYTKVNPCCGPLAGDAGLGAYAQVGVAGDRRLIDWPEDGVQMLLTSVIGWNPSTDGSGAWNAQGTRFTHDSARGADDGLGYRKFLQQGWYNPIDALDPSDPWDNSHNQWNFQYNAEKYCPVDPESQTFDLKLEVFKVGDAPKTYRVQWWVRFHKAASWDEGNKIANWACPWNGAINNAATGTADNENNSTCIDEVPLETAHVNGAWYRIKSPATPGNSYFDVINVDFTKVFPHIGIHNGGNSANLGQTIYWESLSVEGETYPGKISVTPSPYDYLDVNLGATKSQTFVVENIADDANLKVANMYISGANAGDFSVVGPLSFTLGPGEKRDVIVDFYPLFQGLRTAELKIESNDPDNPILSVPLRGTGIALIPEFSIDEAKVDWKIKPDDDKIHVKGSFVLPSDSNGLVAGDAITFVFGQFNQTITAYEIKGKGKTWEFDRAKEETGIKKMTIEFKKNDIAFDIRVDSVELGDMKSWINPVIISLEIGDDKGTATVLMKEHKDFWDYRK